MAAVRRDVVVVVEHAVGQPVVAHELPDVLHDIQLGTFGWQRQERDVGRYLDLAGEMPSGLIKQQDRVPSCPHHGADLGQMQVHARGSAEGQDQRCAGSLARADGAEDVGGRITQILRSRRPGAAPCPAASDLVLLADPGLIGEPDLYRIAADALVLGDACQRGGEVFLKASTAPAAWAWCLGRAESLRQPMARIWRLRV